MTDFFHHVATNTLIYPARDAASLLANIPDARQINGQYVAVPRSLRNLQVCRYFNYPVTPIMDDYPWPAPPGIKPYESQKVAANFMVLHRRCFNLSDMGVGKTLATLWAADFVMRQYPPGQCRALVVAPLSILQRVWGDAIFRTFLGGRQYAVLHGDAATRRSLLQQDVDFYIINFEGVSVGAHTRKRVELDGFSKELAGRTDIRLAIVDEASAYKNSTTKRHRISRMVFGSKEYLWLLTGTPTPNEPTDAYGLAKLVNNAFGKSFTGFRQDTMVNITMGGRASFKWVPKPDGYDRARKLLTPSIRFDIKDVWDGPEMTTQQREVQLTVEQKKQMADLKRDLQLVVKSGRPITAANEAAARQKFIQISLGAVYDENHGTHKVDAGPRLEELRAVIAEAAGNKMLIFAPLTSVVELLHRELKNCSREIVNGNVTQKERSRIFSAFQETAEPQIIIADPGTMAHGLDLYAARYVVWYGGTDKAELYTQANKRAHRPGQKFPVSVVQIVSNALEREIYRRLETNTSLQGVLLDMVRKGEI